MPEVPRTGPPGHLISQRSNLSISGWVWQRKVIRIHHAAFVEKSQSNAVHAGIIIECDTGSLYYVTQFLFYFNLIYHIKSTNICSHYDIQRKLFESSIKPREGPVYTYAGTVLGTKSEYSEFQTFFIFPLIKNATVHSPFNIQLSPNNENSS